MNTRITAVSNLFVTVGELLILLAVGALIPWRKRGAASIWLCCIITALLVLSFARMSFDPQALREVFIAFLFFWLGREYGDAGGADRLVRVLSCVVIGVGVVEYFFKDTYLQFFDILDYYASRGQMVSEDTITNLTDNLFVSGNRPGGRSLLPVLGQRVSVQRVSSVFLEPVSMGNYAIIISLWALSFDKQEWRKAAWHLAGAVILIVACDSRFAILMVCLLVVTRLSYRLFDWLVLAYMPVAVFAGIALYSVFSGISADGDDLPARLQISGETLLSTTANLPTLVGYGVIDPMSRWFDSGISFSIATFGIPLLVALWASFLLVPAATVEAVRFRTMMAVYCLGILAISGTSFYSMKTASLLWFLFGVLVSQDTKMISRWRGRTPHPLRSCAIPSYHPRHPKPFIFGERRLSSYRGQQGGKEGPRDEPQG